jgi:methylase of polypeptide subunit release factors
MQQTVKQNAAGFAFIIKPTVFNPADFVSSEVFADFIKSLNLHGKNILDMGSGSGIISIVAASKGAVCTAIDINPEAVKCIADNARLNMLEKNISAIESDLFEVLINSKLKSLNLSNSANSNYLYDFIFFNPPYYKGNPKNSFERGFKGGLNLEVINNFFIQAKEFITHNGKIFVLISSDADLNLIFSFIQNAGYKYSIYKTIKKFFETFYIIECVIN